MDLYMEATLGNDEARAVYDRKIMVRKSKRTTLTKLLTKMSKSTLITLEEASKYIQCLEKVSKELSITQDDLNNFALAYEFWDENDLDNQADAAEDYNDRAQSAIASMKLILSPAVSVPTTPLVTTPAIKQQFILPKMELPVFGGKQEDYLKFITTLNSMLDKYQLGETEISLSPKTAYWPGQTFIVLSEVGRYDLH
jgi:hypothetical protein